MSVCLLEVYRCPFVHQWFTSVCSSVSGLQVCSSVSVVQVSVLLLVVYNCPFVCEQCTDIRKSIGDVHGPVYVSEVVRTRLRQEGDKYRSFVQTVRLVAREEGARALYGGLATQLVRQIPNTAIMMATYELVVYLCSSPR